MLLKPRTAVVLVVLVGTAIAVAGSAIAGNKLIPDTTSMPSPTATTTLLGIQLSQAQLNVFQSDLASKGFNITQPLNLSGGIGSGANGSTFYKGTISKNPGQQFNFTVTYNVTIEVCKDNATADSHFSSTVSNLQKSGIVGSYNSPRQWSGVSTLNGIQVNSSVTKSATGPPYTVTTIE